MDNLNKKVELLLSKMTTIEKALEKIDQMSNAIDELTKSVNFLSNKYEEIKSNLKKSIEYQEILNKSNTKILKENKELKQDMTDLKMKIANLERVALESTFNIFPVMEIENINPRETVYKVGQAIGVELNESNVTAVFRRPTRKNGKPGDLVVKCVSPAVRNKVLEAIKAKKLMHTDIGITCNLGRIYGNEELSSDGKDIYYAAFKTKKEKGWKYLWVKYGRIYVRMTEGGQVIRLDTMNDLIKLQ